MQGRFEVDESVILSSLPAENQVLNGAQSWFPIGDLFINLFFFLKGIIIISTEKSNINRFGSSNSFYINDREFVLYAGNALTSQCLNAAQDQCPNATSLKKITTLTSMLSLFLRNNERSFLQVHHEEKVVLFNKKRRDEIFVPVVLNHPTASEPTGLYMYPWAAKKITKLDEFLGFSQFITAGCLFGATLRAITQYGEEITLMDHRLQLEPSQSICAIQCDTTGGNPFELAWFHELEKMCHLIRAFSRPNQSKKLIYHLPAHDYILFGLKWWIQGNMTFFALNQLVRMIILKKDEYQEQVRKISQNYEIEVQFSSPFDNLFSLTHFDQTSPTLSILTQLGWNQTLQVHASEQRFVQNCLILLKKNEMNTTQQTIWRDFLAHYVNEPDDVESLFKLANAVMIAAASYGKQDNDVCSLLPLSEKPIQVEYCKHYQHSQMVPYPAVFFITLFEPIITYSSINNHLLFYFKSNTSFLSSLISKHRLPDYAAKNVAFFSKSATGFSDGAVMDKRNLGYLTSMLNLELDQDKENSLNATQHVI